MTLQNSKTIPRDELRMLTALIEDANWRDTTTFPPEQQHAYILQEDYPVLFESLDKSIREYGFKKKFYGRTYTYLLIGDFKYWRIHMVINREILELSENEARSD